MKTQIKIILLATLMPIAAMSADKMKMNFNNEDVTKVIEAYSKAYAQKFVVDAAVRGKVTIFFPEAVEQEEAFNALSSSLAINGYGISKQGDTMVVRSARNIQRDYIETSVNKPSMKPERMYTWIYNVKNIPAASINRDLRVLVSRDGEMSVTASSNQLIITDWTSNLNRIADLFAEVDKKPTAEATKLAESGRKPPMEQHRPGKGNKAPPEFPPEQKPIKE